MAMIFDKRTWTTLAIAALALSGCMAKPAESQEEETIQPTSAMPVPDAIGGTLSAAERERCLRSGGLVERRGRMGAELCVHRYSDAGKVCSDKRDCLGKCIGRPAAGSPGDHPTGRVTGLCQADDRLFGCYSEIENGREVRAICVD